MKLLLLIILVSFSPCWFLPIASSASFSKSCSESLGDPSFQEEDLVTYVRSSFQTDKTTVKEKKIAIPIRQIEPPPEDYRFYLVPKFLFPKNEISKTFIDQSLKEIALTNDSYVHSYFDQNSGDQWAVFKSPQGDQYNLNVTLLPIHSEAFTKEFKRITDIVTKKAKASKYDSFFSEAIYFDGAWNKKPMNLLHQNEIWPDSSGTRIETYPIGLPLGNAHDHLMIANELVVYRDQHLVVQNIRRFRSIESREENLHRGEHYLGIPGASEKDIIAKGHQKFLDLLGEIHESILPDYLGRRHWTKDFIDKLIEDAISMQNQIEFTLIREIAPDLKFGKIVGIVGFNVGAYGHVDFFDPQQNQWSRATGLTGTSVARYHPDKIPFGDASYAPEFWSAPIAQLPIENYLKEGKILPRPSVLERIERPSSRLPHPSSRPIFFYGGENLEVTRLWNNRHTPNRQQVFAKLLYAWIHRIHASGQSLEYTLKAMAHVTYNPEKEGRRLYKPYGYDVAPDLELKQEALKKAVTFISDSKNFMDAIAQPDFLESRLNEDEMQALVFYLNFHIGDFWSEAPSASSP